MKVLSFTHSHIITNLHDYFFLLNTKRRYFENFHGLQCWLDPNIEQNIIIWGSSEEEMHIG